MKISLRKLIATVSGLAIAATLPVASMMASAAGDAKLSLTPSATTVGAGDTVDVTLSVSGLSKDNYWETLNFEIGYDDTQMTVVKDYEGQGYKVLGAMGTVAPMVSLDAKDNDGNSIVTFGGFSLSHMETNGDLASFQFKVNDDVKIGDELKVSVKVLELNAVDLEGNETPVIEANTTFDTTLKVVDKELEAAKAALDKAVKDAEAKLADGKTYTADTKKALEDALAAAKALSEDASAEDMQTAAKTVNDAIAALKVEGGSASSTTTTTGANTSETEDTGSDVTEPTDDVIVPTEDNGGNGGAQTGESTTLFVLALVLMAGSAVALVGMKKKVFSK